MLSSEEGSTKLMLQKLTENTLDIASVAQYYSDLALVPIRPSLIATISLVWLPQNSTSSDTKLLIDYYPPKE